MAKLMNRIICVLILSIVIFTPIAFAHSPAGDPAPDTTANGSLVSSFRNEASNTGNPVQARNNLNHSSSYVRQMAGKVVSEYGTLLDASLLDSKAQSETNPFVKDALYESMVKLEYRLISDPLNYIIARLASLASLNDIPISAALFLMNKAIDHQVTASIASLEVIRSKTQGLEERIDQAIELIELGHAEALNSQEETIRTQAIHSIARLKTKEAYELANDQLIEYLKSKKGNDILRLRAEMEQSGVLRAENQNPFLESGTSLPDGWSAQQTAPGAALAFSTETPHSFTKSFRVSQLSGETRLRSNTITLEALPLNGGVIEYGLFYRTAFQDHLTITNPPDPNRPILKLKIESGSMVHETVIENPYDFDWKEIGDSITLNSGPIQDVILTITFQGEGDFFIDDVYVRRAESAFDNLPPEASLVTANPETVLLNPETEEGAVTLVASATDPEGAPVSGKWNSSLEGELGEGLQITAYLTKPGTHHISFIPIDDYGFEGSVKTLTVEAIKPFLLLTGPSLNTPASGTKTFHVELSGATSSLPISNARLEINDLFAGSFTTLPADISVNTNDFENGLYQAKAKLTLQGQDITSNIHTFEIKN